MFWANRAASSRLRSQALKSEATPTGSRRRRRRQARSLRRPPSSARPLRRRRIYATGGVGATLTAGAVSATSGGGQPHENRQPSLTINYIISLFGIFPLHRAGIGGVEAGGERMEPFCRPDHRFPV